MCTVPWPPDINPFTVNKYIIKHKINGPFIFCLNTRFLRNLSSCFNFPKTGNNMVTHKHRKLRATVLWHYSVRGHIQEKIFTVQECTTKPVVDIIIYLSVVKWKVRYNMGTLLAQWFRCCATNRKAADSIPTGVIGFFIGINSFRSHYGPGVDSASNRNDYQDYFLGVKTAGA